MALSIVDHNVKVPYDLYHSYDVNFYNDQIDTLVTRSPSYAGGWISEIESIHRHRLHKLIVGLDVEWRPSFNRNFNNPVATLQLSVGHRCLIFQILHSVYVPQNLSDFLANSAYTFVGVGIKDDNERILRDYGLQVSNMVDLRGLAADQYGLGHLKNAGLKGLANLVLGKEIEKPLNVTLSRWDNHYLNLDQVQYACIDAFVSFEIGRSLNAAGD